MVELENKRIEELEKKYFTIISDELKKSKEHLFNRAEKINTEDSKSQKSNNNIDNYFEREMNFMCDILFHELNFVPWNGTNSSDCSYSNEDVIIHIDTKTTNISFWAEGTREAGKRKNLTDFIYGKANDKKDLILVGSNQNSIGGITNLGIKYEPFLNPKVGNKIVLTFIIRFLWEEVEDDDSIKILEVSLFNIPNGLLKNCLEDMNIIQNSKSPNSTTPTNRYMINIFRKPFLTDGWERMEYIYKENFKFKKE